MSSWTGEARNSSNYNLIGKIGSDLTAASVSATLVAPAVTIIDRAIVEKTSSNDGLINILKRHTTCCLRQPQRFFVSKPFFIVSSLYGATYSTANLSETIAKDIFQVTDTATVQSAIFISTFVVNVPLGLWKDVRFAQFYGTASDRPIKPIPDTRSGTAMPSPRLSSPSAVTAKVVGRVPISICATFLLRDALTISGSFTLADMLSGYIPNSLTANPHTKSILSQLVVPALTQLVAAPVHLFGLDLHNRPHAVRFSNRLVRIRQGMLSTVAARCFRLIPAFGIGCIMNRELRLMGHAAFQEEMMNNS
ncbi:hypothetical protein AOR_1_62174 [Paecilomyces variotii No. 5]|uniref:Sequence orphan n=1 Tax=Byssochlamys spectabilis (strain No. 5 / NBRC 109023) TaxID=1356009 RepID=V5HWJ4_BYSSN|nr:hypothetical protein AOR_1_62174 [Paecilomyces variotii No. 5]